MWLTHLEYWEKQNQPDEWKLHDLSLGQFNFIVSKNAAGKTRCTNVIKHIAESLSGRSNRLFDGDTAMQFLLDSNQYFLDLTIENNKVFREIYKKNEEILIDRTNKGGTIKSFRNNKEEPIEIEPPVDKLTVQVRRDKKEFPFLEHLFDWANNLITIRFGKLFSGNIITFGDSDIIVSKNEEGLNLPFMLNKIFVSESDKNNLIESFNSVGFQIKNIELGKIQASDREAPIIIINEEGLKGTLPQFNLSAGMFRSIATVITIVYLLSLKGSGSTIIIDDLGEGLDFERSNKLAHWLYEYIMGSNSQLIATSNDFFLINAINVKHWNVLERIGHEVFAWNQQNKPQEFEEFRLTGLNNFEFFSSEFFRMK